MALAYYRPGQPFDFRNYLLARFSRIYPVYILSFALTCLYYLDIVSKIKPAKFLASVLLYQAWIPDYALSFNIAAWSLSVEAFFYILLPFLLLLAMRRSASEVIWFAVGFFILSESLHYYLPMHAHPGMENFLEYFPPFHLSAFLTGLAGGVWYLAYSTNQVVHQIANRILLVISLGWVMLLLTIRKFMPGLPIFLQVDSVFIPLFLAIILTLAFENSWLSQIMKHPWLVLLGDASYAVYILHIPIRFLFMRIIDLTGNKVTLDSTFIIYVAFTVVFSVLTFVYIERPIRDWLRRNPYMLTKILLDVILIAIMIHLSFVLRVGTDTSAHTHTQTFAIRAGVAIFFIALLIFRFYLTQSWRSLALAFLFGGIALGGSVYLAWTSGWVESFPRSILILIPVLCFASISVSRLLMSRAISKLQTGSDHTV